MPTIRYQIRNEYGLADPELYRVADNEDPEALLEGVAMAGLVGVLRQLGDLAEFAAEIFHDLHEEVTATAARGHELMLRVQQVEAEFPSIEKAFLTQTNHSQFAYNEGIDWHANLRVDQNLVIQGDMPRFILDSYEECRGPPRLFMLDKFDVAGAGACLKRYSDPSFFKVELASSGLMEEDVLRERKSRKIKKKGSRWRDGEIAESFLAPLINSNLQPESSGHVSAKVPTRRVKLKSRNLLDSEITNRKSYMEQLLEPHSQDQKVWPENSISNFLFVKGSVASSGSTPEVPETIIEAIADSPIVGVGNYTESLTEELENNKVKSADILGTIPMKMVTSESKNEREGSYLSHKPEKSLLTLLDMKRPLSDAEGNKSQKVPVLLANVDPKKSLASTEFTPKGDLDECKSDGISSDPDNYLDALNTTESEFETDSESRERSELSFSNMRAHGMDSESCQLKQELSEQIPLDAVENSITSKELNGTNEHSFSNSDISHDVADTQIQNHENGFGVPAGNNNVEEYAESVHVLRNGSCNVNELDVASIKSEVGDAYSGSFLSDSASSHVNLCTQGNDEAQSADPLQDDAIFDYVEGTLAATENLDCKVKELSDFYGVSSTLLDQFTLLSKKGDSSVETKDEGIYPAVRVDEQNSETLGGSVVTSDHLPTAKNGSTFEVIATQNIEPIVDLTAKSEEEEQDLVEQDGEACFSGSVLPSIPEASPELGTTVLHPKDLSYEESKHDISSSHQVAEDLDNMSALTEESSEFLSRAYNDVKFTEPSKNSSESSDHSLSLPEIHGEVSSIANPKGIDTEICSHEVENFQEVSSNLDGKLPFIEESSEFLSRVYNDMEFTRPMENSGCFEDLLPLFEIPEKNSTPDVEANLFEDSEDIQGKSSPEEDLVMHVEGSTPVSNVQLGALIESTEHGNKNSSSENLSPSHSSLSLRNSQFDTQPDDFAMDVGNNLAVHKGSDADDMEEGKHLLPLAGPVELECTSDQDKPQESEVLSPRKEESSDGICPPFKPSTNDMVKVNILMDNAGLLELANISDEKEPNVFHDADLARNLPSDVVFSDDVPLQNEEIGHMVTSDEEDPKEARDADAEEHLSSCPVNEMFSDGSHKHEEEPGCVRMDSISPVTDFSHEPIADASEFPNASKVDILQKEVLRLDDDTEFDDPSDEYVIVETDGDNQGTASIYSGKASEFDEHLLENYLQHNALMAEHDLDVNEASNSTTLNPQDESPSIPSAEVPSSELTILKSCNDSDVGSLDGACCSELSKDPEPYIASENLIYQPGNVDSVSIEVMFPHIHFSVEAEISSGDDSEANVAFSDKEGEPSAVSDQESEHLEASGTQPQRACVDEKNITQSFCKNIEDQPSQPEPFGYLSSGESNELDAPLSNSGMHEKVKNDTSVASDCSSEISAASLSPSVSSAGLQLVENSSHNMSETSIHEASESGPGPSSSSNLQVVDETPPLPPLPPVEWRIGKLRLGSVITSGDPIQHQLVTSLFTELRRGDESYSQGLATTKVEKVQSAEHFSCLPVTENERFHFVSSISEEEISHPSKLSELRPLEDEVREESSQIVEGEIENRPAPFIAVSHTEDRKSSSYNTASVSAIDDETIRHPQLSQGGGQSAQHRGLQLSHLLRSLELERSQLEAFNVARNPVSPLNPFVVVSSPEEWKNQYGYGVIGHESGQHINMSAPFAATGPNLPPYGFLYPVGENPSNIYNFMIPSTEGEKKYRSIRDRPRDPLIEAVAAHDKSKLRKVSHLDRLPVRATTDERNSLLEQIKNKSFNLKPANSTKPNIKGVPGVPPTNLKIAAILEKANAIRQACVGSDEDEDDADSWSDS